MTKSAAKSAKGAKEKEKEKKQGSGSGSGVGKGDQRELKQKEVVTEQVDNKKKRQLFSFFL